MMAFWALITLLSAIIFGIKDILVKNLLTKNKNVKPNQILFEQILLTILIILLIFFSKIDLFHFTDLFYLYFIKSFAVTFSMLIYFDLLKKYEISHVSPLLNLSPVLLIFLSFFILGEIISYYQFLGILIIIISTYFLEITIKHHKEKVPYKFHFLKIKSFKFRFFFKIFSMLLFLSITAITDKILLSKINIFTNLFFTSLIVFIVMVIYYFKNHEISKRFNLIIKEPETLVISAFSILSNFLVLIAIAIPGALVSLIVPIRRTSTLFSSIFGGVIFHEKHLFKKILLIIFMLIGVLLITF